MSERANSLRSPVSSLTPNLSRDDDGMSDELVVLDDSDGDDECDEGVGDGITALKWCVVADEDDGVEAMEDDVDNCDDRIDDCLSEVAEDEGCGCGSHSNDFSNNTFSSEIISEKLLSKKCLKIETQIKG